MPYLAARTTFPVSPVRSFLSSFLSDNSAIFQSIMSNLTMGPFRIGNFDNIFDNKKQRSPKRPQVFPYLYTLSSEESGAETRRNEKEVLEKTSLFYIRISATSEKSADARLDKPTDRRVLLVRNYSAAQTETQQMRPYTKSLFRLICRNSDPKAP